MGGAGLAQVLAQGWPSGESAPLPPVWPGFKSRRRRHMWIEFVVGSLLYSERFFSGFSPPLVNQHFQIQIRPGVRWTKKMYVDVLPLNLLYLFYSIVFVYFFVLYLKTFSVVIG